MDITTPLNGAEGLAQQGPGASPQQQGQQQQQQQQRSPGNAANGSGGSGGGLYGAGAGGPFMGVSTPPKGGMM